MDRTAITILANEYRVLKAKIVLMNTIERHAFTDLDARDLSELHHKAESLAWGIASRFPLRDGFDDEAALWSGRATEHKEEYTTLDSVVSKDEP